MSSPKETKIGRFVVRSRVGSGAFGTVYRAFDPQLERDVALKVPQKGTLDNPRAAERFLREAKAAARLRHPHIVPVYEAAQDASCPYIATAFIEGRTLAQVIDAQPPGLRHAVQVVHDLADALAYAHGQGVVHRDVKPANVMLDEKGRALLMDFGLAQQQDEASKLTGAGAVLGTPSYMPPEQARGSHGPARPASDQYSLGVVLYELLCGRTPFTGPPGVVLYNVIHTDPPPPRGIQPSVPRELEAICLKAMAKRPEDRFAGMSDFAAALAAYLWTATATATATPVASDSNERVFSAMTIETAAAPPRRSRGRSARFAAAAVALLAVAAAAYFTLRPQYGTVRFELSDPKAEVAMRLDGRELPATEWARPMRLPVGKYELEATGKAVEPVKHAFEVTRGENQPVRVELKAKAPPLKKADPGPVVSPKPPDAGKYPPPLDADRMITNTIGMKLAFIPKGKIVKGAGDVEIPHDFHIGVFEVTQGEWEAVMKAPSKSRHPAAGAIKAGVPGLDLSDVPMFPVESVSWSETQQFLAALNAKEKRSGTVYRLPTQAEWEYACREGPAGNPGDHGYNFYVGGPTNQLTLKQANFEAGGVGLGRTCRVGSYPPNRRGLHDMHGNVWEWCDDVIAGKTPAGAKDGPGRTARGGPYDFLPWAAGSPHPIVLSEGYSSQNTGFRIVLALRAAKAVAPAPKPADVPWAVADILQGRVPAPDTSKAKKLLDDTFSDSKSGFENHADTDGSREAYVNGKYVVTNPDRSYRRSHRLKEESFGDAAYEVRGRLTAGPTDGWELQLNNFQQKKGVSVRIRGNGTIAVSPGAVDSVKEGLSGPSLPTLLHRAIKKGGEWNTVLLVVRRGGLEMYVNGVAVCSPLPLDPDFEPNRLQFTLSTLAAGEVEFERLTVYAADGLPALAPTPRP